MTTYTMTGPDGKDYSIDGPPGATQAQVAAQMHAHFSNATAPIPQTTVGGLAKSALTGLVKSGTSLGSSMLNVIAPGTDTFTKPLLDAAYSAPTGGYHQPANDAEHAAETVGSFLPALAAGPEGVLAKAASVLAPAAGSEIGYHAAKGTPYEGVAQTVGALLGGGLSGVRARAPQAPSLIGDVSPETSGLYQNMKRLGVNVRPAQTAAPGFVKTADAELQRIPLTGYGKGSLPTDAQQNAQFTRAVSRLIGEDSPALTENVMGNAYTRIGKVFDTVIPRNSITADQEAATGIGKLQQALARVTPALDPKDVKRIDGTINAVATPLLSAAKMPGSIYQSMRQRGGLLDTLSNDSNPTVAQFGNKLRNIMDDAFQRQAPAEDAQAIATARQQYRVAKTIDPLVAAAPKGVISPPALAARVRAEYPDMSTGGAGDLGVLARGGQAFLKEPPNSTTAERALVLRSLAEPTALASGAAGLGALAGGTAGAVTGIPLALLSARLLKNAVNSRSAERALMGQPESPPMLRYTNPYPTALPVGGMFGRGP